MLQVTSAAEGKLFDCDVTDRNTHTATLIGNPTVTRRVCDSGFKRQLITHMCVIQDLEGN